MSKRSTCTICNLKTKRDYLHVVDKSSNGNKYACKGSVYHSSTCTIKYYELKERELKQQLVRISTIKSAFKSEHQFRIDKSRTRQS